MSTDRRTHFANDDIAHISLRGQINAAQFSEGTLMQVAVPVADLHASPDTPALDRQILFGHKVCLLDAATGFARDETSGHVGYVDPAHLALWQAPTHRVQKRQTLIFDRPDIKTPGPRLISCGALLRIEGSTENFARCSEGFIPAHHLSYIDSTQPDFAATAEKLRGTPYLWGGNSATGIDCSGLVQLALQAAGLPCPGDSDQQMAQLGTILPVGTAPQRNDLFFWKGHVALAYDPQTLIHANAGAMAVALEPLDTAIARIAAQGDGPVIAHKRLLAEA